jgi:acetyl-CoA synthetase
MNRGPRSQTRRDVRAEDAKVAWLLCDRHPADDVALTVDTASDASTLTFGQLAADSRCGRARVGAAASTDR